MDESPPDALQRLIIVRMRELGRSYGDVARLGKLPRSTVHYLATHRHSGRLPKPDTLERLAAGLDLPLNVIRAAAASAAGLVLDPAAIGDPEVEVLIASFARLSPADRRHVAALVRSMLAAAELASPDRRGEFIYSVPAAGEDHRASGNPARTPPSPAEAVP